MFSALHLKQQHIDDLWHPIEHIEQRNQLMSTLSKMKVRFGTDCIQVGYHSPQNSWKMKQQHRSPRYTTCWNEILTIDDSHMAVTQIK